MKKLKIQLAYCVFYVVVLGALAVITFMTGFFIVGTIASVFIVLSIGSWLYNLRDYKFYRELNYQMAGMSMSQKLEILNGYEELWLTYAEDAEVKEFREAGRFLPPTHPCYKDLNYLLERAVVYKK